MGIGQKCKSSQLRLFPPYNIYFDHKTNLPGEAGFYNDMLVVELGCDSAVFKALYFQMLYVHRQDALGQAPSDRHVQPLLTFMHECMHTHTQPPLHTHTHTHTHTHIHTHSCYYLWNSFRQLPKIESAPPGSPSGGAAAVGCDGGGPRSRATGTHSGAQGRLAGWLRPASLRSCHVARKAWGHHSHPPTPTLLNTSDASTDHQ